MLLLHPAEWLGPVVDTTTSFQEEANISVGKLSFLDEDLGGHEQFEHDLVTLEQTSVDVPVHRHGEARDNVLHTNLWQLILLGVNDGPLEESNELAQGGVVHPLHQCHLDNTEVEHGTSGCDWSEDFSLIVNFDLLLRGLLQFLCDFLGLGLDSGEHIDQLDVVKEGAFGRGESLQQLIFIGLKCLGVVCYLFLQLLKLVFE